MYYNFNQFVALKMCKQHGRIISHNDLVIQEWGTDATLGKRYVKTLYKGTPFTYIYTPMDINA